MDMDTRRARAEALWEELGGDLCLCQQRDVPHWCESCQRRMDTIAAAFRRLVVPAWQPIATAPTARLGNGFVHPVILGFAATSDSEDVYWSREGFWDEALEGWICTLDPGWLTEPQPTHWMPLPEAPEEPVS